MKAPKPSVERDAEQTAETRSTQRTSLSNQSAVPGDGDGNWLGARSTGIRQITVSKRSRLLSLTFGAGVGLGAPRQEPEQVREAIEVLEDLDVLKEALLP